VIPAASYGLAQAARNTPLGRGQTVVITAEQFPSNVYIWRRLAAAAGAQVRVVAAPSDGPGRARGWNEALLDAVSRETAVVAVGHVHWTDGTLFDLEALRARTREVGAALVVDGTQSVGALPFDVAHIQPDALVCAGYKWLMGPYAIGVAFYGPRYDGGVPLEETWPARRGSEDFARLVDYDDRYREGAARYDVGEACNFVSVPMQVAALEQILGWDPARIEAYGRALSETLVGELRERGFQVTDDARRGGHLFGVRPPPGTDPAMLAGRLRERNVYVSVRGSALRVSVHLFNDAADMEALRAALVT
jgi:selenocysteine lyase/cysteine desulfurase